MTLTTWPNPLAGTLDADHNTAAYQDQPRVLQEFPHARPTSPRGQAPQRECFLTEPEITGERAKKISSQDKHSGTDTLQNLSVG